MSPKNILAEIFDRAMKHGPETLSNDERELYLIQDFIIEFEMGGLTNYLYNRSAIPGHIPSTIRSMQKYRLLDLARILTATSELFSAVQSESSSGTWSEMLDRCDPDGQLAANEQRINDLVNYGMQDDFPDFPPPTPEVRP